MNPQELEEGTCSSYRIEQLDERWSVVAGSNDELHCVLRRWPDEGLDLLEADSKFTAIGLREGRMPAPRYERVSRWQRRQTGRWLGVASNDGSSAGVLPLDRDEPDQWWCRARRLFNALQSTTTPLADQLTECGYHPIARSSDGRFEVRVNRRFAGLPLVACDRESWCLLTSGSELRRWDPVTTVPDDPHDAPDEDDRRRWYIDVEWRIPVGPMDAYQGALEELRAFHPRPTESEQGGQLDRFHHWELPSPHFHLDDRFMVATAEECTRTDARNRDWRRSMESWLWREYGDKEIGCGDC